MTRMIGERVMLYAWLLISVFAAEARAEPPAVAMIVVIGAPGTPEYTDELRGWSADWQSAAATGGASFICIGDDVEADSAPSGAPLERKSDRDRLHQALTGEHSENIAPLWLVLLGHGTFDGQTAKFNLRGPDVSADELAVWLEPVKRPVVVINCASASAPFINKLSGKNRVVITATKSGSEQSFARFGQFLSAAFGNPNADLDKDDQVSLLEAYLIACRQVSEYYAQESRLATEHALLDDNGDGLGTPADWFRGVRAVQAAKEGGAADGTRAHQVHLIASDRKAGMPTELRDRRNHLEQELAQLRSKKASLREDEYFARLEPLLVELATLYDRAHSGEVIEDDDNPPKPPGSD